MESLYNNHITVGEAESLRIAREIDNTIKSNRKSLLKVLSHIRALKKYMLDRDVKWIRKSVVIAALIYLITPFDTMPDITPLIGFLDDIGVIAWTIRFLGNELKKYY
jgi:uncharacterized membrane protein YkvA (DUF1232 family)